MFYNPYDLVAMEINGKPIMGRPFVFDSDVADQKEMKNAAGEYVRPTKLSTMCPDCGAGLVVEVQLAEPRINPPGGSGPFDTVRVNCEHCNPVPPPVEPFENPLESGRVDASDLDPLVVGVPVGLEDDGQTAEERMAAREAEAVRQTEETPPVVPETSAVTEETPAVTAETSAATPETPPADENAPPQPPETPPEPVVQQPAPKPASSKKSKKKAKGKPGQATTQAPASTNPLVEPADDMGEEEDLDAISGNLDDAQDSQ